MTDSNEPKFEGTLPSGAPATGERIINSNAGWNYLTDNLGRKMPHELTHAHHAIEGLRRMTRRRR